MCISHRVIKIKWLKGRKWGSRIVKFIVMSQKSNLLF